MYYATGARYEGQWTKDKKQGQGVFVFENGDAWQGPFELDRPVLGEGEQFAPKVRAEGRERVKGREAEGKVGCSRMR